MVNSLNDGLSKPDQFESAGIDSTEIGSYAIKAVNVSGGIITADKLAYGQIATGSPITYGRSVLFGANVSTAGSILNVTFGNVFKAAPTIVLFANSGVPNLVAGSVAVTGFTALTVGGSETVNWIAAGSGTF